MYKTYYRALDNTKFAGHDVTGQFDYDTYTGKSVLRRKFIEDVYYIYAYKGEILMKHGRICPGHLFYQYEDERTKNSCDYHTNTPRVPYICNKGRVWVLDKSEIPYAIEVIKDYKMQRLREDKDRDSIRKTNALAIVSA